MAKTTKIERGAKTAAIVELARRRNGVSGAEIIEATGWPVGNAKERIGRLAVSYGFTPARVERADGTVAYRLAGRAAVKAAAEDASKAA
jgi:hypothetical protein